MAGRQTFEVRRAVTLAQRANLSQDQVCSRGAMISDASIAGWSCVDLT